MKNEINSGINDRIEQLHWTPSVRTSVFVVVGRLGHVHKTQTLTMLGILRLLNTSLSPF